MTERERLIGILKTTIYPREGADPSEVVADYLIDNGVIVPPCKVGDKVYNYDNGGRIYESEVVWFYYDKDYKRVIYDCNTELAFSEEAQSVKPYF